MSLSQGDAFLSCPGLVDLGVLLPHLAGVIVDEVTAAAGLLLVTARARAPEAACPGCGTVSRRVHSRYARTLADAALSITSCSVCGGPVPERGVRQVWLSARVATDVLPLLVNACSDACVGVLPQGAEGHVRVPHPGGLGTRSAQGALRPAPRITYLAGKCRIFCSNKSSRSESSIGRSATSSDC